ncbi:hypothetical protein AAVH_18488 [Aphelenchoides avenae]|nr:hypothetical protein AAVH_18488 [Aphelenchus avenae]
MANAVTNDRLGCLHIETWVVMMAVVDFCSFHLIGSVVLLFALCHRSPAWYTSYSILIYVRMMIVGTALVYTIAGPSGSSDGDSLYSDNPRFPGKPTSLDQLEIICILTAMFLYTAWTTVVAKRAKRFAEGQIRLQVPYHMLTRFRLINGARFEALYGQRMLHGEHETSAAGNAKPPPTELYLEWVLEV